MHPLRTALFLSGFLPCLALAADGGDAMLVLPLPLPLAGGQADDEGAAADAAMFQAAQINGSIAAYQRYLARYPDGVFAELARFEIAAIKSGSSTDPVGRDTQATDAAPSGQGDAAAPVHAGPVTFEAPLKSPDPALDGQSLAQLITGTPLFPPIEGLPEAYWKTETCAKCHQWDRGALCDQGKFYVAHEATPNIGKAHPYGGLFKQYVRLWAEDGCN